MAKKVAIMKTPKAAFSLQEIKALKKDFAKSNITLIVVAYGNNSPWTPEIEFPRLS